MSLPLRILFAASMFVCAGLCIWAAVAFGGPATLVMWITGAICIALAVAVMFIRGDAPKTLSRRRAKGALDRTCAEAAALHIDARRSLFGGVAGLLIGGFILAGGIAGFNKQPGEPAGRRAGPIAFGGVVVLFGLSKLTHGVVLRTQAGRLARNAHAE